MPNSLNTDIEMQLSVPAPPDGGVQTTDLRIVPDSTDPTDQYRIYGGYKMYQYTGCHCLRICPNVHGDIRTSCHCPRISRMTCMHRMSRTCRPTGWHCVRISIIYECSASSAIHQVFLCDVTKIKKFLSSSGFMLHLSSKLKKKSMLLKL